MQESNIEVGDTVTVLSGPSKGDQGGVTAINRQTRSHYIRRHYIVRMSDGSQGEFESVEQRPVRGDDKPRDTAMLAAKALDLEKVVEAKLAKETAPAKPPAAKPKEETRPAREA